jgi:hypothetical protein
MFLLYFLLHGIKTYQKAIFQHEILLTAILSLQNTKLSSRKEKTLIYFILKFEQK